MSLPDTKERLLDAAERLFAQEGIHCTSLRAITARAKVNLASVNYHFGSKEALVQAVFERRLTPLNEERLRRLGEVRTTAEKNGCPPDLKQTMAGFIEPTLRFRNACPGSADFVVLVGRALHEPDDNIRNMFVDLMRPVFVLLLDTLRRSLPMIDMNTLFWRLHFALGAMGHTLCWAGQIQGLSGLPEGVNAAPDADSLSELLLTFVIAGMEAP